LAEPQEEKPVPPPTFWDMLSRFFHRQDELLGYVAETQRQSLALLRVLSGVPAGVALPSPRIEVTAISDIAVKGLVQDLLKAPLPVLASPFGRVKKKGTLASVGTSYTTVCEITVTSGKTFDLANFSLSGYGDNMWVKLVWQGNDLTPVFYVMEHLPFVQWFPPHYYTDEGKALVGDGQSRLQLQVRAETGTITVCDGELVGDET
jgi:hypothetical protein